MVSPAIRRLLLTGRQALASVSPATFVDANSVLFSSTPTTVTIPPGSGLQPNDILIFNLVCNGTFTGSVISQNGSGTAFTLLASNTWSVLGYNNRLFWLKLTSADISSGTFQVTGTASNDNGGMVVYRGASTVTSKQFVSSAQTDTTLVFPGFAPDPASKGVVAMFMDRDPAADSPVGSPSTWTSRFNGAHTFDRHFIQDCLSGYANTAQTFSPMQGTFEQGGYMAELT